MGGVVVIVEQQQAGVGSVSEVACADKVHSWQTKCFWSKQVNMKSRSVLGSHCTWGFLLLWHLAELVAFAQIIPASRLPAWRGNVGVPGGIPYRTNIYVTIPAGASLSTIQSALNGCPSNGVVKLSAGTYTISGSLNVPSHVTLRGAGLDVTVINSSSDYPIKAQASFANDYGSPIRANHVSWISGYAQGSTELVLAATNLAGGPEAIPVGNILMIDQQSDTNCSASGGYGTQGVWWSIASPTTGADRYQHEFSYVTSKNGHTITIDSPIKYANYNAAALPQVWFVAGTPVRFAGIEDLTVQNTGGNNSAHGIGLSYAYGCWIRNCREIKFRYGINTYLAVRCEIRHCTSGQPSGSGDDYKFNLFYTGNCLFEDNIVNSFNSAFLLESCVGNAFAYNYTTNANSTSGGNMNSGDFNSHGGNNALNLMEGSSHVQVSLDNGWGSAYGFVLLRNRIRGWDEAGSSYGNYVAAIDVYSMNRFMTFVGNVLGTSGKNTVYESQSTGNNRVYLTQLSIGGYPPSPDPVVTSSMIRAMNWDSANNGIVTGGYTSNDVPASLLYTSKPAYFGSLRWPPIDPTNPTYSSSRTNIPAGFRFIFGVDPPSGPVNQPPVVVVSATPTNPKVGEDVTFSSSGSYDPEGNTLAYNWEFGDGTTSSSGNPVHAYTQRNWRAYSVVLRVFDGTNTTSSAPLTIRTQGEGPSAGTVPAWILGSPTKGAAPLTVQFHPGASWSDYNQSSTLVLNFGDGTISTNPSTAHVYSQPGLYDIAISALSSGASNRILSLPNYITVTNAP
jgi:hypothetical protein